MIPIKIKFVDFWPGFNEKDNFFINTLGKYYKLELSDDPDILFFSCYGKKNLQYNCHKIMYLAENQRPDFRITDFAISFDYLDDPRHLRLPLYVMYFDEKYTVKQLVERKTEETLDRIIKEKTGFCCFIVSNPKASTRIDFFHQLSKYKKVDSGGSVLNNIGDKIGSKLQFVKQYKFTIAFENSSYSGYTTEKVLEPLQENSIPIYWGNPDIGLEMNTKSFLNYHDYGSFDKLIERVVEIDSNVDLYRQMLREPLFHNHLPNEYFDENRLAVFFEKVVQSVQDVPVSKTFSFKLIKSQMLLKELSKKFVQ